MSVLFLPLMQDIIIRHKMSRGQFYYNPVQEQLSQNVKLSDGNPELKNQSYSLNIRGFGVFSLFFL